MRVSNRLADLGEDRNESPVVGGFGFEQVGECLALDEFHCQKGSSVRQCADVVNRRNRGVLKLTCDADFVEKPARSRRTGRNVFPQKLDRDIATEGDFSRAIDDSHPTSADFFEEFVAWWGDRGCGSTCTDGQFNCLFGEIWQAVRDG